MNKLLIILLSFGFTFGAFAQPKIGTANRQAITRSLSTSPGVKSNVVMVAPAYRFYPRMSMSYSRFGYGRLGYGLGYSPFYDPFYDPYQRVQRETELDVAIEDIKEDFSYKIDVVKDDKGLTKDERKQRVRDLKHQRENAISAAKKSYYENKRNK